MSVFRLKCEKAGGHIHCALFVAKSPNMTYAKCGDFVVSEGREFDDLRLALSGVEFFVQRATND